MVETRAVLALEATALMVMVEDDAVQGVAVDDVTPDPDPARIGMCPDDGHRDAALAVDDDASQGPEQTKPVIL